MRRLLVFLIVASAVLTGCNTVQQAEEAPPPEDIVSDTGTVRYVELEGGFYGIIADDSTRFLPDSLARSFRQDGLRVRFRARLREDVMTAQMWGTPVAIIDIMRLEE